MYKSNRDLGMTLPEVLISVVIISMMATVLTALIRVTYISHTASNGRVQVARDEQALDLLLPNDLSSAVEADVSPDAKPCPGNCSPGPTAEGSNALLLKWIAGGEGRPGAIHVRVSYLFVKTPGGNGNEYELRRVHCSSSDGSSWRCDEQAVLRQLSGPPGGEPFVPGVTVPTWAFQVSAPLAAGAVDDGDEATGEKIKDARRVVVTINGGGRLPGAGGGANQISITAGGTERSTIEPSDVFENPSFTSIPSRCGGPITLIVDDSGSIGGAMDTVRNGVKSFIETFAGTPTQLQVVRFDTTAEVLGAGSAWSRYFDLTDPSETQELIGQLSKLSAGGGTNWEDAFFRALHKPDGTLQQTIPEMIVFFTDGHPTFERLFHRSAPGQIVEGQPPRPGPGWPKYGNGQYSNGRDFTQVGFNRADWIVDQVRASVRTIGVAIGGILTTTSPWSDDPGAGYHLQYERGFRRFQKLSGGNWVWIGSAEYNAGNQSDGSSDGFRQVTKEYVTNSADAKEWEPTSEQRTDGGYRAVKVYRPPYTKYDPPSTVEISNKTILSRIVAGNDHAVEARWNAATGTYENADTAELFTLTNVASFSAALRSVALAECGGTLSLGTALSDGSKLPTEVAYQNTKVTDGQGNELAVTPGVVSVSPEFPTGTFDFDTPDAGSVTVEIAPVDSAELRDFAPNRSKPWVCLSGVTPVPATAVELPDSDWLGVRVSVGTNNAVSCKMQVVRK